MNTWRTLLPHELDDIEKKIEAGEALDVGLLRSLVTMARRMEVAVGEYEQESAVSYGRGYNDGYDAGYNAGYDDSYAENMPEDT